MSFESNRKIEVVSDFSHIESDFPSTYTFFKEVSFNTEPEELRVKIESALNEEQRENIEEITKSFWKVWKNWKGKEAPSPTDLDNVGKIEEGLQKREV